MQSALPADLFARVEERVYLEIEGKQERSMHPDVRVVEHDRNGGTAVAVLGEIEVVEPYVIELEHEPVTETFIEIRDASSGNRVITVIEFLSPTNKLPGKGQQLYRKKQEELLSANVSLVEIDLVRTGEKSFSIDEYEIPAHIRTPYQVVVRRGWKASKAEIYPLPIRERLPTFRIPLRQTDRDTALNLQTLIDQAYVNGRYGTIDYRADAEPPLKGEDAEWADALLRATGKRK
jgi:hypothetical protein